MRSFVLRAGRITPAQERAFLELWPRYGLGFSADPLEFDRVFGRTVARVLEIGFGDARLLKVKLVEELLVRLPHDGRRANG